MNKLEPTLLQTYPNNLDYHNVSLISRQISHISSRSSIDTSTDFCGVKLEVPIVASPMKDVCDGKAALKIRECGGFAFLHRFCTIEEQIKEFEISEKTAGCAIGITGDWLERYQKLFDAGCNIFCIDVANGASISVEDAIIVLGHTQCYGATFVVGNVCSKEGYEHLVSGWCGMALIGGVRVGVAGGGGCTTRNATGIYHPSLSLIDECKQLKDSYGFLFRKTIIADGGIKEPQDLCKALIFGADVVMMGSQIAACKDSPAKYDENDWNGWDEDCQVKIFRGSASYENQLLYKEEPKYIEGATRYLECKETIEQLFNRYREGLRSSMSYFNARNLDQYRANLDYTIL